MAGQPTPKRKRYCAGGDEKLENSNGERRGRRGKDQPSILSFISKQTQRDFSKNISKNIESLTEAKVTGGSKKKRGEKRKIRGDYKNFHLKPGRDEPEPKRNQGS